VRLDGGASRVRAAVLCGNAVHGQLFAQKAGNNTIRLERERIGW
jgi:hypothetical protein